MHETLPARVGAFALSALFLAALIASGVPAACGGGASPQGDATATDATADDTTAATTEAVDPCDRDADEVLAVACGGEDCDDENPEVHPGALDNSWAIETIDIDLLGPAITSELVLAARPGST